MSSNDFAMSAYEIIKCQREGKRKSLILGQFFHFQIFETFGNLERNFCIKPNKCFLHWSQNCCRATTYNDSQMPGSTTGTIITQLHFKEILLIYLCTVYLNR